MVEVYTNINWVGSSIDKRFMLRYCTHVWGNLVMWRRKKQPMFAQSSVVVEFHALTHGVCEGIWLERLLSEL